MSTAFFQHSVAAGLASGAVALGLFFAPASVGETLRTGVRDGVRPGQWLAKAVVAKIEAGLKSVRVRERERADFKPDLSVWKRRCRRLQIENARLHEKLRRQHGGPYLTTAGDPLVVTELLESTVLGTERGGLEQAGLLIDKGHIDGILESVPVLEGEGPVIDQGRDAAVAEDQPVYSGRVVVGKIAGVGRWASTVRLVTDRTYRNEARLARVTSRGVLFGAEGVFAGQGEKLCRLNLVPATEQVRAGDEVYTTTGTGTLSHPMYYGKVVKAELKTGASSWDIWVEPALNGIDLRTVQVLRRTFNPRRVAGQP